MPNALEPKSIQQFLTEEDCPRPTENLAFLQTAWSKIQFVVQYYPLVAFATPARMAAPVHLWQGYFSHSRTTYYLLSADA